MFSSWKIGNSLTHRTQVQSYSCLRNWERGLSCASSLGFMDRRMPWQDGVNFRFYSRIQVKLACYLKGPEGARPMLRSKPSSGCLTSFSSPLLCPSLRLFASLPHCRWPSQCKQRGLITQPGWARVCWVHRVQESTSRESWVCFSAPPGSRAGLCLSLPLRFPLPSPGPFSSLFSCPLYSIPSLLFLSFLLGCSLLDNNSPKQYSFG